MTTDFKPAIEELQDLISNLNEEEKQAFRDVPFEELPIESVTLGHILQAIPEELQRRYESKIIQLKKLNALARIRKDVHPSEQRPIMQTLDVTIENDDKSVDITYKIGNTIIQQYKFKTADDTKEIFRYDEDVGIWKNDGAVFIEDLLKKNGLKLSSHNIREILYHVQTSTYEERSNFTGLLDGNMLHVANGWLNMDTLELEPHTPDRLSIGKMPTAFDRNAGPVEFIRMMNQALTDPEYRQRLLKVLGNLLIPDARYEKATLFVGEGHNRKGSIIFAIHSTIGKENCCTVSLQEISEDRFATSDFYGKMANLVADLSAQKISNTGRFKELVSGDMIRAQRKHQQPFQFKNQAKMIFSTNNIPPSDDQTHAYFRRWEIIPFYKSFDKDPTLQERLSTERERSGILNLILCGRKLLIHEGFDDTSIERVRFLYNRNASVAKDFLAEECVIDFVQDDFKTKTTGLQDAYVNYCIEKKHKKKSDREGLIRQLGEELNRLGVENRQRGPRDDRQRYYVGIKLKSEIAKTQTRLPRSDE